MNFNELQVIIQRIKEGDKESMSELYRNYRGEFITWITSNYSCTPNEAREMYQISIQILYENVLAGKLTELSSDVKTYLFAIGKNQFLAYKKSRNKISFTDEFPETEEPEQASDQYHQTKVKLVGRSLNDLGEPCKSLLELYYYHNYSMQEIADRLDYKNSSTTKNLKYKCLKRLRKIYMKALPTLFNSEDK